MVNGCKELLKLMVITIILEFYWSKAVKNYMLEHMKIVFLLGKYKIQVGEENIIKITLQGLLKLFP